MVINTLVHWQLWEVTTLGLNLSYQANYVAHYETARSSVNISPSTEQMQSHKFTIEPHPPIYV